MQPTSPCKAVWLTLWQLVRKHICGHALRIITATVHICRAWHDALQHVLQNAQLLEGSSQHVAQDHVL